MAEPTHITSHWEDTVADSVLEQYRESPKWQAVLKSVIDRFQVVEDDAYELLSVFRYDTSDRPAGYRLDYLAGLINVTRTDGESDDSLVSRMETVIGNKDAGTSDRVIYYASLQSGDSAPVFFEESPATFFVYTPNGTQLTRSAVSKLAPAGVLGVPAAKIKFLNGSTIRAVGEYTMGVIANDSETDKHIEAIDNGTSVIIGGVTNTGKRAFVGVAIDH